MKKWNVRLNQTEGNSLLDSTIAGHILGQSKYCGKVSGPFNYKAVKMQFSLRVPDYNAIYNADISLL